ncbi:hypothetical protein BDN72DRAFT_842616 [Pluteus cervinus]|uniref:Uncharacterized protein n=1 Tax=Pluteus cervinus TaxID=181527 RepID=A0ACD3AQI1_9AGAR|nr:hypothetical protein BDN72DRAFT_842616 [Pluteus cervinus]
MIAVDWRGINVLPPSFYPQPVQQRVLQPVDTIRSHFAHEMVRPAIEIANLLINRRPGAPILDWPREHHDSAVGGNFGFLQIPPPHRRQEPSWNVDVQGFFAKIAPLNITQPLLVYEFKTPAFACEDVQREIVSISGTGLPYQWYRYDPAVEAAVMKQMTKNPENHPTMGAGPDSKTPIFKFITQHAAEIPEVLPYRTIEDHTRGSRLIHSAEERAHLTLQHAWKQSVIRDTTFFVINMGNKEIIGYRDRATRTLFLSDPITLNDPNYSRLLTGLFIATFVDFVKRMNRLWNAMGLDITTLETEEERRRIQEIRYNYLTPPQILPQPDARLVAMQEYLEALPHENHLAIVPSIRVKINSPPFSMRNFVTWSRDYSEATWTFIYQLALGDTYAQRSELLASIPRENWPNTGLSLTLVTSGVLSSFGWSAELKRERSFLRRGLAARIGVGPVQVQDLRDDYNGYLWLRWAAVDPSVLPQYHTFVESPEDGPGSTAIVVAEPSGERVTKPGLGPLHPDFGERFRKVLRAIHYRGYLHNSLVADNLYVRQNGASVYILDFSKVARMAEGDAGRQQCEDEMGQLNTILGQYIPGLVIPAPNLAGPHVVQMVKPETIV